MEYVKLFREGGAEQKDLLGGKGANLAEMTNMGLPVPPGFIVTTEACRAYLTEGGVPAPLFEEVAEALSHVEDQAGRRFGDPSDPLLVSVRSGARFSMPGMMDTVLNLGLNPETVKGLEVATGDERFAQDAWRRFIEMFGSVVLEVPDGVFERVRGEVLGHPEAPDASTLSADVLRTLGERYERAIADELGHAFPHDPMDQLHASIEAVFRSWNGKRARDYRKHEGIADDLGTAVNVQTMVFGNRGDDSGTGVAFTRDPATGNPEPYGDFLVNAQGEDVVAGVRVTQALEEMSDTFPEIHDELLGILDRLEMHYQDMCDIEFTIENGELWILQTRVGKRTARAAVRMAVDMANEGLIDERTAVLRVKPGQLDQLLHPRFADDIEIDVLTTGLNASPGAAVGHVYFTADDAEAAVERGETVILLRPETSPDDLHGILASAGVLTARGGLVSHAAVVARGIGKPAVCGASELDVDVEERRATVNGTVIEQGDLISIDGTTGQVVLGEVDVVTPEPSPELETLLGWADGFRRLGVRANADTGEDAARARAFGAEGIGLCRTEHMFLGDRVPVVQRMILADTPEEQSAALAELHDLQVADFLEILEAMDGLHVTVRLLDPPLHEFLPHMDELLVAEALGELDDEGLEVLHTASLWREANPMLGVRGVRLGVVKPELYRMQTRALIEAAVERANAGGDPKVQIMIPLIVSAAELAHVVASVREVAEQVLEAAGIDLEYHVGTMVETPRAALTAAEIAGHAEFLSFGTNDLTQMTFGFSRDDVEGRLMPPYLEHGLLPADPFETIDIDGVGRLMKLAVEEASAANPTIETGICGEHGADPASVTFCHQIGLDYVSCSPYRISVARLAAAHAALGQG